MWEPKICRETGRMKTRSHAILLAGVLSPFLSVPAGAQEEGSPIIIGQEQTIFSEALQEPRTIRVRTPDGYGEGDGSYPVLYVLDGGPRIFHTVTGITRWLGGQPGNPRFIVVGIDTGANRAENLIPPWLQRGKVGAGVIGS